MSSILTIPPGDDFWAELPAPVRDEIRAWIRAFRTVPLVRPFKSVDARIARMMNTSAKTVERYRLALAKGGDYRVFLDRRKTAAAASSRIKDPAFQQFIKKLYEDHKRVIASAIEDLYGRWRRREHIPGYEDFPGWPNIPESWSERNLYRQAPSKTELKIFRIGMSAAYAGLPQTFSTRVGLWPMSHIVFDDLVHDNFIRVGTRGALGRTLELDAMDVLSGNKFAWGTKPKLPKLDNPNVMEGLKETNMRLLVASVLTLHGYNPRGTVLMAEHGTAAIRDRVEQVLFDATGGQIRVRRSGITGDEQGVLSSWKGDAKGNPRFKACLESFRNLIHNRLDALPGQTGRNRDNRPEVLSALLDYQEELLEIAAKLPPHRRELLIHPLLEYHSQFLPLLGDIYGAINGRHNHSLEGWAKLGFITTEYRLSPTSTEWLGTRELLALPDTARAILMEAAQSAPRDYANTRRLSPAEVFTQGREQLQTITPEVVCDLLLEDLQREEKVKGAYFTFSDSEIDPEELRFEARIIAPGATRPQELAEGEKFLVFVNPFAPDWLYVCNARKQFLGLARRVQRISPVDENGLLHAWGHNKERKADRLAAARDRHADDSTAHREMIEINQAVIDGSPITADEKSTARKSASIERSLKRREVPLDTIAGALASDAEEQGPAFSPDQISDLLKD